MVGCHGCARHGGRRAVRGSVWGGGAGPAWRSCSAETCARRPDPSHPKALSHQTAGRRPSLSAPPFPPPLFPASGRLPQFVFCPTAGRPGCGRASAWARRHGLPHRGRLCARHQAGGRGRDGALRDAHEGAASPPPPSSWAGAVVDSRNVGRRGGGGVCGTAWALRDAYRAGEPARAQAPRRPLSDRIRRLGPEAAVRPARGQRLG